MEKEIKEMQDLINEMKTEKSAMEKLRTEMQGKGNSPEMEQKIADLTKTIEEKNTTIEEMKSSISTMSEKINKLSVKEVDENSKPVEFKQAVMDALLSDDFQAQEKELVEGKRAKVSVELKNVTLASFIMDVSRTQMRPGFESAANAPTPLYDGVTKVSYEAGKDRVGYMDVDFTANCGYTKEMVAMTTKSTMSGRERYVEDSEIGAFMPYSAQVAKRNPSLVQYGIAQLQVSLMQHLDNLLLSGAGNDSDKLDEIRGIDLYATEFDNTDLAFAIASPLENDLLAVMKLYSRTISNDGFIPKIILMSAANHLAIKAAKNADKDAIRYTNVSINGDTTTIDGMVVQDSVRLSNDVFYVMDPKARTLYDGKFELEIERVASTNSFVAYVRWSGQQLITERGKKGIIKVSDITAALTAITKV